MVQVSVKVFLKIIATKISCSGDHGVSGSLLGSHQCLLLYQLGPPGFNLTSLCIIQLTEDIASRFCFLFPHNCFPSAICTVTMKRNAGGLLKCPLSLQASVNNSSNWRLLTFCLVGHERNKCKCVQHILNFPKHILMFLKEELDTAAIITHTKPHEKGDFSQINHNFIHLTASLQHGFD